MAVSESEFRAAMADMANKMQMVERGLNARIALAEAEILRLRSSREDSSKSRDSCILDAKKIYPAKLTDMGRWRPWTERVIRWAKMQSTDLAAALAEALKSRDTPVAHSCAEESTFFWAHLEDWIVDSEASSIVRLVRDDDGVEAFRQLNNRFDSQTALTKSHRLKQIQKFTDKNRAKKNTEVPAILAKFEDMLLRYREDYSSDALSDDLVKEALKDLIPTALETTVKDIIMFRNLKEDTLNSSQMRTIIMERIAGDVMNQVIRMDVDNVEANGVNPAE